MTKVQNKQNKRVYISRVALARFYRVLPAQFRQMQRRGLPFVRIGGKVYYALDVLREWCQERLK